MGAAATPRRPGRWPGLWLRGGRPRFADNFSFLSHSKEEVEGLCNWDLRAAASRPPAPGRRCRPARPRAWAAEAPAVRLFLLLGTSRNGVPWSLPFRPVGYGAATQRAAPRTNEANVPTEAVCNRDTRRAPPPTGHWRGPSREALPKSNFVIRGDVEASIYIQVLITSMNT